MNRLQLFQLITLNYCVLETAMIVTSTGNIYRGAGADPETWGGGVTKLENCIMIIVFLVVDHLKEAELFPRF